MADLDEEGSLYKCGIGGKGGLGNGIVSYQTILINNRKNHLKKDR